MNKKLLSILAVAFSIVPILAWAPPASTKLVEVIPDYSAGELTILGVLLSDEVNTPLVELGGNSLTVTSFDANTIVADVNLNTYVAGDYLLIVDPNSKKGSTVETLLTLGAVGPAGETGAQGPAGDSHAGQSCDLEVVCGNGTVENGAPLVGFAGDGSLICQYPEECDTGGASATCDPDCTAPECGDGLVNNAAGEDCDDGNTSDGDGCSSTCSVEVASCGNGIPEAPEACDDGNTDNDDGCDSSCQVEVCGNGILQVHLGETCDDGNLINGDGCDSSCLVEECGNGVLQVHIGETCDDGNLINGDGCSTSCQVEACGDGIVQPALGEECDTGGASATCDADCTSALCGDGVLNGFAGEECDDGNGTNGDGCSAVCLLE